MAGLRHGNWFGLPQVQAIIVAIDQCAEAVLGHRKFFFESAL
jgi:hypothetical protein